jgi:hypothetical protein
MNIRLFSSGVINRVVHRRNGVIHRRNGVVHRGRREKFALIWRKRMGILFVG